MSHQKVSMDIVTWLRDKAGVKHREAANEIERLRALMLPPEGHILLPDGKCVKVLGTLPVTKDGCAVAHEAEVYTPDGTKCENPGNGLVWGPVTFSVDTCERYRVSYPISGCYSTREAATAAQAASKETEHE